MKKENFLKLTLAFSFVLFTVFSAFSQRMQQYTWDSYKTKFQVPNTFQVTKATGDEWQGSNDDIALSIFPRKDENLSQREMDNSLLKWANDEGVANLTTVTDIDSQKLNGYWGVFVEGTKDSFPVCLMLIIDPDYPSTSMYIWVSYREGLEDTVLKILYSFTPN